MVRALDEPWSYCTHLIEPGDQLVQTLKPGRGAPAIRRCHALPAPARRLGVTHPPACHRWPRAAQRSCNTVHEQVTQGGRHCYEDAEG